MWLKPITLKNFFTCYFIICTSQSQLGAKNLRVPTDKDNEIVIYCFAWQANQTQFPNSKSNWNQLISTRVFHIHSTRIFYIHTGFKQLQKHSFRPRERARSLSIVLNNHRKIILEAILRENVFAISLKIKRTAIERSVMWVSKHRAHSRL